MRYDFDEKYLLKLFGPFGRVGDINIIKTPGTDKSKGVAFVNMFNSIEAKSAIQGLDGKIVGGRTLKVSEAIENSTPEKTDPPKRKADFKSKEKIIMKKKARRRSGLDELFENTGRK